MASSVKCVAPVTSRLMTGQVRVLTKIAIDRLLTHRRDGRDLRRHSAGPIAGFQCNVWSCRCKICTCIATREVDTGAMRYEQICPVSLASEVLAERWTPLILREIVLFDRRHFSDIQRGVGRI